MARVKRGVTTRAKHKRILDNAKGYYGRRKNTIRIARQAVEKAGQYAYRDRKVKKRSFRALWIQRINAAVRAEGLTYGQFIHAMKLANIDLDRKVLADIAMHEGEAFSGVPAEAVVYYLQGTSGWGPTAGGLRTAPWSARILADDGSLGVSAGHFSFTLAGAAADPVVVESSDQLGPLNWVPVSTNTFNGQGLAQFTDPRPADGPGRMYRLTVP